MGLSVLWPGARSVFASKLISLIHHKSEEVPPKRQLLQRQSAVVCPYVRYLSFCGFPEDVRDFSC